MSTPSTTTTTSSSTSSSPNDAYATTATINFIEKLQSDLSAAQSILSQKQTKLSNAQSQSSALSTQYNAAEAATSLAQSSLTEAENAQALINVLTDFFSQRTSVTSEMVTTATTTAVKMFEATVFVGTKGLDRVDDILNTALAFNKANPKDTTHQWTNPFISNIQVASATGQTALNAAVTATKSSFQTLVSSLQIDSRTQYYYQQCLTYQTMMASLVERLTSEYILLKIQADGLSQQLQEVNLQETLLTTEVNTASFTVAQLQAEYIAAQKGASYTGSSTSPSNN